ncbi:hypothetical protein ES707_11877 [subsurface metagenome]
MSNGKKEDKGGALVIGGVLGAGIATLLAKRPALAAPPEAKWDYLIECQEAIIGLFQQMVDSNTAMIRLLEQLVTAAGLPPAEGVEVIVQTKWEAKEPEQIFYQALRTASTFYSDKMVSWNKGKRFLIKVESSLDQNAQIQLIGNITEDTHLATDINALIPCPANGNISIGPAWDDWHPYVGVKITTAIAPTKGFLKIWAVIQE